MRFINETKLLGCFLVKYVMCDPQLAISHVMCKPQLLHDTPKQFCSVKGTEIRRLWKSVLPGITWVKFMSNAHLWDKYHDNTMLNVIEQCELQDSVKADHVIRTVIWYWNCKALSFLMSCKESVYWKHCECLTSSVCGDLRSSSTLLKVKGTVLYVHIVVLTLVTIFKQKVCDLVDIYIKTLLI